MRSFIRLSAILFVLFLVTGFSYDISKADKKKNSSVGTYMSLDGHKAVERNQLETDGNIHKFNAPLLHLMLTQSKSPRGTILLFPGGGYKILKVKNEGEETARFLNDENFDVAILEYHIASGPDSRNLALIDAYKAFRLIKTNKKLLGLRGNRLSIMGISSGGHLAARTVQKLDQKDQPDDLILISPAYLNETLTGTVIPAVMPPVIPSARLFGTISFNEDSASITNFKEYSKIWKGYDGQATLHILPDSAIDSDKDVNPLDYKLKLSGILKTFLEAEPEMKGPEPNTAAIPVDGGNSKRHQQKLALIAKEKYDLIMVGNSITNMLENTRYQPVWNQFFIPRKTLNLGYSGYRTENIIWNIQNGELEGQSPKLVVVEIGTNNVDEKNYPTRHTAGQLAGGIEAIVNLIREKLPDTKIMILRCFPGCYGGPNPTSHRFILDRASELVSKLSNGKNIFYCDVNHIFLNLDGTLKHELMPDWLHPNLAGAKAWAQAMEPMISELMSDKSLDTEIPENSAIVPASKLENDDYNWWDRHSEILRIKDSINPEIVLIGNSITHFWGGDPKLKDIKGNLRKPNGPRSWTELFGQFRVLNMGFGWDRTQNVLWRLDRGELDGIHPSIVVINIGSNNTVQTRNARMNTAPEIVQGISSVCERVRSKIPGAKIVLMAVFPREQNPNNPRRELIKEINRQLEAFAKEHQIILVDIGPKMLDTDGYFLPDMTLDFCHPIEKGYQIWADALRPIITATFPYFKSFPEAH